MKKAIIATVLFMATLTNGVFAEEETENVRRYAVTVVRYIISDSGDFFEGMVDLTSEYNRAFIEIRQRENSVVHRSSPQPVHDILIQLYDAVGEPAEKIILTSGYRFHAVGRPPTTFFNTRSTVIFPRNQERVVTAQFKENGNGTATVLFLDQRRISLAVLEME